MGDHAVIRAKLLAIRELWRGQRVARLDVGGGEVVQDHVHTGETGLICDRMNIGLRRIALRRPLIIQLLGMQCWQLGARHPERTPSTCAFLAKTRASRDDTMRRAYELVEMLSIDSRQIYCLA